MRSPSPTVCSNSSWRCSQGEFSAVGAVTVSSRLASHGRPWSQQEPDVSVTVEPRAPARLGVWGWPCFIPRQGWSSALFLNVADKDQRPVEDKLTSLWGESLNFSFSGEACLTKYKLLNHMCNKLLQKLPRLQFPAKREEPAFTDTGLQAQAFVGIPCPLLHFPSHFYCFILDLDRQYHWNGLGTAYLRAVFLPAWPPCQHSICKC